MARKSLPRSLRRQAGFWNFIIPAAASIIGGLLGKEGQEDTNDQNAQLTREGWQFNAEQSALTRDWQEDMSSTQYQRAVGDMRKAGLNPMLAYSQGGAGNLPGATASASSPIPMQNSYAAGVQSAAQAVQLSNLQKQGENIDADTALKNAQAQRETSSAGNLEASTTNLKQQLGEIVERMHLLKQQQEESFQRAGAAQADRLLKLAQVKIAEGEIPLVWGKVKLNELEQILKKLEIPEAMAFSEKFKGEWGKDVSPYMREVIDILKALVFGRRGFGH